MTTKLVIVSMLALALLPSATALSGYGEGFEAGVTPAGWTLTGLWKVEDCLAASGSYSLHYTRVPECDFNVGATSGIATTPLIAVDGANPGSLNFESYVDGEYPEEYSSCTYDTANVELSVNGAPFSNVLANLQCETQDAWVLRSIDLTPHAGQTVQVRFVFSSGDASYNGHTGWAIDNVVLTGASVPTPELGSVVLVGVGLIGLVGMVVVNRRK